MPSSERFRAQRQLSYGMEGLPDGWEDVVYRSREPVGPDHLYDLAARLGLGEGSRVLDAGCRDGSGGAELADRFGCICVGADLVVQGGRLAGLEIRLPRAQCDLEALPFPDDAFDGVWCRDVLEDVEHPITVLTELRRVLRPGGGMLLYVIHATELLEPVERARLMAAVDLGEQAFSRQGIEGCIEAAGFTVEFTEDISPQVFERALEDGTFDTQPLLNVARLRRAQAEIEGVIGPVWYEQLLAYNQWNVYVLLGKLQSTVWGLRS
jgi:SAM-dependent methyltransferase